VDTAPTAREIWAADRKQLFRAQVDGIEPHPIAGAVTDREIHILASKVDVMPFQSSRPDCRYGTHPRPRTECSIKSLSAKFTANDPKLSLAYFPPVFSQKPVIGVEADLSIAEGGNGHPLGFLQVSMFVPSRAIAAQTFDAEFSGAVIILLVRFVTCSVQDAR
jgi:hypothetical protein